MENGSFYTGTPRELCSQALTETRPDWMRQMDADEREETVERVEVILDTMLRAFAGIVGQESPSGDRTLLLREIFGITDAEDPDALARYRRACGDRLWLAATETVDRAGRARQRIRMALKVLHAIRNRESEGAASPLDQPYTVRFAEAEAQKRT